MSSKSNQKAHACGQCTRSFGRKNDLERHMNTHRNKDERPWKCSHCPRTFCQKGQRDTHHNTHTGLKPFKCSSCSKAFGDWSARHRHEKKIHGAAPQSRQRRKDCRHDGGPATESIGPQSTLQAQNSISNEMPTAAGVDFGVALDTDTLSLTEAGSSEVSGTIFDVDPYMQNYNYFSGLLLEQQKPEDSFVEVLNPPM